jgi:hypothetical protein
MHGINMHEIVNPIEYPALNLSKTHCNVFSSNICPPTSLKKFGRLMKKAMIHVDIEKNIVFLIEYILL